jgi:hypothetical protein
MVCNALVAGGRLLGVEQQAMRPGWGKLYEWRRQDRSGRAENVVPTGIQSPTVQPEVGRYTDWATKRI